jgi:hypothetical protein
MRRQVDAVQGAIGLLTASGGHTPAAAEPDLLERWLAVLRTCIDRLDVGGLIVGRMVRILTDAERLDDVEARLERALSHGAEAAAKAAWVDGFFADGALLVVHDPALRELLDGWVAGLSEQDFIDVLPLVRRTFGAFAPAERRLIATRVSAAGGPPREPAGQELDLDRAAGALATVRLLLGSL